METTAYKFKYDELTAIEGEDHKTGSDAKDDFFKTSTTPALTLNFKFLDGQQHFEEYAFLKRGNFARMGEKQLIVLNYTDDTEIRISGYHIFKLYRHIQNKTLVSVKQIDERYLKTDDEYIDLMITKEPIVTEISVFKETKES